MKNIHIKLSNGINNKKIFFQKKWEEIHKTYGKIKGLILFPYVISHIILEKIYVFFIKCFFPVKKNLIIFRSFPDYSDNARALAEYMVMNNYIDRYKIYFDVSDINRYHNRHDSITFISLITKTGVRRLRYLRLMYTAGYLMSTHKVIINRQQARKEQKVINLWHGCSFKDRTNQDGKGIAFFDYTIVQGELFVKTKAYFWNIDEKYFLPLGYPRYDWLRTKDSAVQGIIETFKKNKDTKIILWMPTFRIDKRGKCTESNSISQFPLMDDNRKWKDLDELCIEKNIVLIVKLHPFQTEYGIPFDRFSNIIKIDNQFFDDIDIPMYKFVALTDALISDYSSIGIDYLIVNHPLAFTLDDFEEYKKTRGFIIEDPRIYMPGHHLYTYEELKGFLSDVSEGKDLYKEKRERVLGDLITPSNNYCESILDKLGIEQ